MRDDPEFSHGITGPTGAVANIRSGAASAAAGAAGRLNVVQARIDELQRKAALDSTETDEYRALIEERGQLDAILMDSRAD